MQNKIRQVITKGLQMSYLVIDQKAQKCQRLIIADIIRREYLAQIGRRQGLDGGVVEDIDLIIPIDETVTQRRQKNQKDNNGQETGQKDPGISCISVRKSLADAWSE